jgi:hypothetical protein
MKKIKSPAEYRKVQIRRSKREKERREYRRRGINFQPASLFELQTRILAVPTIKRKILKKH